MWDLFVLILALQNSIIIPFDLAYEPEFTGTTGFKIFDFVVDFLFLIDMILMFIHSFLNKKGIEIFDSIKIA
jgi:hypothetical protein